MLRLRKYLYPYFFMFLLTIALLFVQANAELALPDYMSRIVNNGIQQRGIEHPAPEALRESTMEKLFLFLDEQEQALVLDHYTLVEPGTAAYAGYLERYPGLQEEPVYVIQDLSSEEYDALNPVIGKAMLVVFGIQQAVEDPENAPQFGEGFQFDPNMIPPGMDVFQMLAMMPEAQRAMLMEQIDQQFETLGENMVNQMAVGMVQYEYTALGLDSDRLQSRYILRTGGLMLLISLLGGAATIAVSFFAARTAAGVARDIRDALFKKVENFSSTEFSKFSTASLITRSTNDVTQLQMVTFMIMRIDRKSVV